MEAKRKNTCVDTETGEILYPSQYNAETGEYEGVITYQQRTTFRIPSPHKETHKKQKLDKREMELITAAIFLIPTMILFYPVIALLMMVVEITLHNWAHRKNRTLKDDRFYYKSPLHGILKEFCGKCKDASAKQRIGKIQDMRNDKMKKYGLESIRQVVT